MEDKHWLTLKEYQNFQRVLINKYKSELLCSKNHKGKMTNDARCQTVGEQYKGRTATTTNFMGSYECNFKDGTHCCRAKSTANAVLAQCYCLDQKVFQLIRKETKIKAYTDEELQAIPKMLSVEIKRLSFKQLHNFEIGLDSCVNNFTLKRNDQSEETSIPETPESVIRKLLPKRDQHRSYQPHLIVPSKISIYKQIKQLS